MGSRARNKRHSAARRQPVLRASVVIGSILGIFLAGLAILALVVLLWLQNLPDYKDATAYNYAQKTQVYANDGTTLLAEFYVENREPVEMNEISKYVVRGTVATEDERFYEHAGIDPMGILRAALNNLTGGAKEGASTITQQFVRNTILSDEAQQSTLKRKVREAFISLQLEEMYTKDQILLMYLNTINYGQGAYGIQAASHLYFSKDAKDLTIPEAATLIGIPQSPTYNNPIDHYDNCLQRRNLVLDRMRTNGVITQQEYDQAKAEPITLNVTRVEQGDGMKAYKYFTAYVREQLLQQFSADEVFKGGLRVITTLDPKMQDLAQEAADRKLASVSDEKMELAMVAVDPDTGYIKAMIGGSDFDTNQFNLATQAKRQPGSSFKTFTLLAALNEGISPRANLDCRAHVNINGWQVENYGGHDYGVRTLASAFAVSSNTGFAELVTEVGPEKVVEMAKLCGITSDLEPYPSITLGAEEVTVLEMAQAYATIANGGVRHDAVCIERIYKSNGSLLYSADTTGTRVLDTKLTSQAIQVMEGVVTSGTGRSAALYNGQDVAGKTGTSENWRDRWFCGVTPQLSVAIWLGHQDETSLPSWIQADSVFGDFVGKALADSDVEEFPVSAEEMEYTKDDIGNGTGYVSFSDTGVASEGSAAGSGYGSSSDDDDEEEGEDDDGQPAGSGSGSATGSGSGNGGSSADDIPTTGITGPQGGGGRGDAPSTGGTGSGGSSGSGSGGSSTGGSTTGAGSGGGSASGGTGSGGAAGGSGARAA